MLSWCYDTAGSWLVIASCAAACCVTWSYCDSPSYDVPQAYFCDWRSAVALHVCLSLLLPYIFVVHSRGSSISSEMIAKLEPVFSNPTALPASSFYTASRHHHWQCIMPSWHLDTHEPEGLVLVVLNISFYTINAYFVLIVAYCAPLFLPKVLRCTTM